MVRKGLDAAQVCAEWSMNQPLQRIGASWTEPLADR
jgi:hypothetical protein